VAPFNLAHPVYAVCQFSTALSVPKLLEATAVKCLAVCLRDCVYNASTLIVEWAYNYIILYSVGYDAFYCNDDGHIINRVSAGKSVCHEPEPVKMA